MAHATVAISATIFSPRELHPQTVSLLPSVPTDRCSVHDEKLVMSIPKRII